MRPSRLIENFRKYLVQIGHSKTIVRRLPEMIKEFLEKTQKGSCPEQITTGDIAKFMDYIETRSLKKGPGVLSGVSKNLYGYALRKFFIWLEQSGQIEENPVSNYEFIRYAEGSRQPLTKAEIHSLFDAAETFLEKSLLHLFYSCGLRRNEAVQLEVSDLDFKKKLLYVREGKGCKRRVIPITGLAKRDFYEYTHKERKSTEENSFLIGKTYKGMLGNMMRLRVQKIGKRAGLNKVFSLHHLRHSIATHLLGEGMKLEYVKNFLGHASLETTQIYVKVKKSSLKGL